MNPCITTGDSTGGNAGNQFTETGLRRRAITRSETEEEHPMATALRTALALIWGVALGLLSYMILTEVGSEHNLRLALFTFFMAFLSVTFNRFMVLAFTTSALTAWAFVAFVWIILGEATAANAIATWIVAALGMFVFTLPRLVLGEKP